MPDLRVIVGRLASACDLVRRRCPRRVALDRKAHLPGRFDNRCPALRPVTDQVPGHACDARELSILPILFDADAETLLEAPCHGIAVDRSRRLHPGVDRVLVQCPVLAVPVCPGGIEDHTVGMKLRVVVPAGSMLEHRRCYIGGKHLDLAVPVTDTGIGAMPQHCFLQRYPSRIVMRPLDLRTQFRIGDRPQGGNTLVRAEGQVETGRAPLAARVLCEFAPAAWGKAVVQPVKVTAVDLAAVGKAEQGMRVEPDAIRFFSRCVVFVGMTEGALALQVVGSCRGLGQSGYHGAGSLAALSVRYIAWSRYCPILTVIVLMVPVPGIPTLTTGYGNARTILHNMARLSELIEI